MMLTELHQNMNDTITSLGSSLEARMNTQEKETEERFSAMESVFTLRMQKLKTQSVDGAADMAREMEDRQDRANNIIMFNVPESSGGSRVEQQVDDMTLVKKMCVILGADNAQIITRRLGRKIETENRPIRVEITDTNIKKTIFKNARHLREEEDLTLRNVFITQDLTPSQREEQKEPRRRSIHVNPPSFVRSLRHFGIAENLRPGDENLRHLTVTSRIKKNCIYFFRN